MRGWRFDYYVAYVPPFLQKEPHGNFHIALQNGMRLHIGKPPKAHDEQTLFIPEGGAGQEAYEGIFLLAQEIVAWQKEVGIAKLVIFLPSGTGTTALFLQKALRKLDSPSRVYTVACIKDSAYLNVQFFALEKEQTLHPTILEPIGSYRFGGIYKEHYELWKRLGEQTGATFDLLYDPVGWQTLLHHIDLFEDPILYIHQGGTRGNESMLRRYNCHKEIQSSVV